MSLIRRIKDKVKKKIDRLRSRLKSKKPVLILSAFIALALTGCQQIPSRSQSQVFEGCHFTFIIDTPTNQVPCVEVGTQAMAIETSGTEHLSTAQETSPSATLNSGVSVPISE